jgi:flavin reductase (DIM6/NTAB) family NADH-FMN oxidoreductase RutF
MEGQAAVVQEAMDAFTQLIDDPLMVVTVAAIDGEISGCLAGFVTQCSIRPPRFLVCISKANHTFFVAERSIAIALHLLGADQASMATLFGASTGDTVDKFRHCDWHTGISGAPRLDHCASWLEGVVMGRHSVGDHEALLMRPTSGGRGGRVGLFTSKIAPKIDAGHPA